VADIFQAIAQNRPYRQGMTVEQIQAVLLDLSSQGKLDAQVVNVALAHMAECMAAALPPSL
jgi:HD-GYP domain-containing protein (c-di-GMP phosphodiesterase class II)